MPTTANDDKEEAHDAAEADHALCDGSRDDALPAEDSSHPSLI
jgi:hypothetical protein